METSLKKQFWNKRIKQSAEMAEKRKNRKKDLRVAKSREGLDINKPNCPGKHQQVSQHASSWRDSL